ncbi:MAG: chromate transporter [Clostridia bacterium]|nr:chromate transporter [Clostridia bacterium]
MLRLFLTFLKIGAFTFGGGYAMIAIIEHEIVEKKQWISKDDFLDMIAVAESTPGPIAINSATYVGFKVGGVPGSAAATLGVVLPSLVIIYLISLIFDKFLAFKYVGYAFRGIQACVVYLILSAGIKMFKSLEKKPFNICIVCAVVVLMTVFSLFSVNFSSIFLILISGAAGLAAYFIKKEKFKEDKE